MLLLHFLLLSIFGDWLAIRDYLYAFIFFYGSFMYANEYRFFYGACKTASTDVFVKCAGYCLQTAFLYIKGVFHCIDCNVIHKYCMVDPIYHYLARPSMATLNQCGDTIEAWEVPLF